jgi:hypothetical protein
MRVWVILGCFAVAIMGVAVVIDMNPETALVRTAR